MDLEELADIVETMILHHDYPGFEPRSLNWGYRKTLYDLGQSVCSGARAQKRLCEAVQSALVSIEAGVAKTYISALLGLLNDSDEWVRMETIAVLERFNAPLPETVITVATLLRDPDVEVRRECRESHWQDGRQVEKQGRGIIGCYRRRLSIRMPACAGKATNFASIG